MWKTGKKKQEIMVSQRGKVPYMEKKMMKKRFWITCIAMAIVLCSCGNGSASNKTETIDDEVNDEQTQKAAESASNDYNNENDTYSVYISVIDSLSKQYGELRTTPWLSKVEDPDGISREVNGVCYLRLLDFDNDGDLELYAVCKNEEDEDYTGRVYSLENGENPIFEESVNSALGYWNQNIELVCKDEAQYYIYVRDYPDGRGGQNIERLYGYNPAYPGHFSYTRFSSVEESEWEDGTWHTEYMIRDDAINEEWIIYDETEYNKTEEMWWSGAKLEASLCVRSSSGEISENEMTNAINETVRQLTGGQ